jgi:hypothetical protein
MNKAQSNSERSSDKLTWSKYTGRCIQCGRRFRISDRAMAEMREAYGEGQYEEEYANSVEWCLGCATGEEVEGEIVESEA